MEKAANQLLYFERSQSAVLECPIYGNAIYVFQSNWQTLAKLSKLELLEREKGNVQRIIHNDYWFEKLEWLIKNRENFLIEKENLKRSKMN